MVKQILMHEVIIALIILAADSLIFIQVHCSYSGKIQITIPVPFDQLLVKTNRSGSCCQSKHTIRFHNDLCRNDACCPSTHFLIIFCPVYSHFIYSISHILLRTGSTIDGATLSSSIPICTNRSVSAVSAPSSPQMPTHLPCLWAPSIVFCIILRTAS